MTKFLFKSEIQASADSSAIFLLCLPVTAAGVLELPAAEVLGWTAFSFPFGDSRVSWPEMGRLCWDPANATIVTT